MKKSSIGLLPRYFNIVGIGILLICIAWLILGAANIVPVSKAVAVKVFKDGILLSLWIFALTKNKIEDELTLKIRVKSLATAFTFGVLYYVIRPVTDLFFGDSFTSPIESFDILLTMLIFYFIIFYINNKKR